MRAGGLGLRRPLQIGSTRRRLSFFVMVLCHSRMIYVEFTLGEALEHFLGCHQNALEFLGASPGAIVIDNLKTGVLSHPLGEKALFHPRYLDFAAHYGFEPRACNVRKANEKGRVENAVAYVKKNFLAGLELPRLLSALNTAARYWMDQIANLRIHGEAKKRPIDLFAEEKPHLKAAAALAADTSVARTVRATNRCRVVLDTNRYSVPALYASARLTLKLFADRLCIYHASNLVATHPRSYERHRDFENPDHIKELLDQRRKARDAKLLLSFYSLSPRAEEYHHQLAQRRLNPRFHINKIVALADIYGADKLARAIEDAFDCEAFSSEYIANILEQRQRLTPQPGPLHLTRRADLLEVDLGPADLSPYQPEKNQPSHEIDRRPCLARPPSRLPMPILRQATLPEPGDRNRRKELSHLDYLAQLAEGEASLRRTVPSPAASKPPAFPSSKPSTPSAGTGLRKSTASRSRTSSVSSSSKTKPTSFSSAWSALGKTHLATALGYAACLRGKSVLFANAIDMINTLSAAQNKGTLKAELRKYLSPSVLILDEVGYLPIDQRGADLLFQVISPLRARLHRADHQQSLQAVARYLQRRLHHYLRRPRPPPPPRRNRPHRRHKLSE